MRETLDIDHRWEDDSLDPEQELIQPSLSAQVCGFIPAVSWKEERIYMGARCRTETGVRH